jgi:hypothetical protein
MITGLRHSREMTLRCLLAEIRVQKSRKPVRCQDTTVSGLTMIKARCQSFQLLEQNPREMIGLSQSGSRAVPLKHRELLADGQVLQSNFPNIAGQNKKANQRTKQRKHEVQREDQRGREVNCFRSDGVLARHSLSFSFRSNFCGGPRRKARTDDQPGCP